MNGRGFNVSKTRPYFVAENRGYFTYFLPFWM